MHRWIALTSVLELVIIISAAQPKEAGSKCTPNDPRQIYPECMLYSVDKSLWCDQSNYSKVPDAEEINGYLPDGDCTHATALYVNDSCITELSENGLLKFKKISMFCAENNKISDLKGATFQGNKELMEINLRMNRITRISSTTFKGLTKLRILNLDSNAISQVDSHAFRDLKSLRKLILSNNELYVLEDRYLNPLAGLEELHITGNKLRHIQDHAFYGLSSLTHLHLDGNKIQVMQSGHLKHLKKLQVLTISHNEIHVWPEEFGVPFTSLHTLDLGHNLISDFKSTHIANLSKLQNLSLENNSLRSIDENMFASTPRLVYLNLGLNYIEDIPTNTFKDLCYLNSLVLKHNHIKLPRQEWFQRFVERKYAGNDTDVGGNQWECNCDIIKYREFLMKLQSDEMAYGLPEWASKLDIVCYLPKQFRGKRLSEIYDYEFKDMNCEQPANPTTTPDKQDESENCTTTEQFETQTIKLYRPRPMPRVLPIHHPTGSPEGMPSTIFWAVIIGVGVFVGLMAVIFVAFWCGWCRCGGVRRSAKRRSKARKSESAEPCLKEGNQEASTNREDVFVEA